MMHLRLAVFAMVAVLPLSAETPREALHHAVAHTQATAVVVDFATGKVIAQEGVARRGTPGSTIKPFVLEYALQHGLVKAETQVYCHRNLRIAGRDFACTHPASLPVVDAETALAESCNTWFAALARRMPPQELEQAVAAILLPHESLRFASMDQRQLAVLGVWGSTASPLELAQAYRALVQRLPQDSVVARSLRESVEHGMANPAATRGVTILGKTGTAQNPGESWTHGWFAGVVPGRLVIVMYVPRGDGGTAARLAHGFFTEMAR